jgi:hypothetical protein
MTKNGCCTSRRSFLSRFAGSFLAASLPTPRVFTGDKMPVPNYADHGQKVPKTHLKWETFVTPSIAVVHDGFRAG